MANEFIPISDEELFEAIGRIILSDWLDELPQNDTLQSAVGVLRDWHICKSGEWFTACAAK